VLQLELVQLERDHAQILMYLLGHMTRSWGSCSCIFLSYLVACPLLSYCQYKHYLYLFWPPRGQNYQLHIRCIENVILFRQFLCHSAHNMDLYFWFQASLLHLPCVLTSQEVSRTVTSTVHFWDTLGLTVTIIVMNWSQAAQVSSVAQVYCLFIPLFLSSLKY